MRFVRTRRTALIAVPLALAVMSMPAAAATESSSIVGARATVQDATGTTLGSVTLVAANGKLVIAGRLAGLTPGFHGFHIHSVGVCEAPFTTAGGHLNPAGTTHGHHAGDLPSLSVANDGVAAAIVEIDSVTLAQILDADGAAFIVHALPDNFANIPTRYEAAGIPGPDAATLATGDSGARVACGVIT